MLLRAHRHHQPRVRRGAVLLAATMLSLAHFASEADALLSRSGPVLRPPLAGAARGCAGAATAPRARPRAAWPARRGAARRAPLRLAMVEEPQEPGAKKAAEPAAAREEDFEGMDESQRKFKAAAIRKEAVDLDEAAAELRKKATEQEQEAARLRIQAWCVPSAAGPAAARARVRRARQRRPNRPCMRCAHTRVARAPARPRTTGLAGPQAGRPVGRGSPDRG